MIRIVCQYTFEKDSFEFRYLLILPLSVIGLSAELLPEVEAKIIVIPTLILVAALCILELTERWRHKRRSF